MQLISLNAGQPQVVKTDRGDVLTSIFKQPVEGRRKIAPHNLEGDRQSDLTVHGGPRKAIYAYAWDHYSYWAEALGEASLAAGAFGENLTIQGLAESNIHIGDVVKIGTARLRVTEPRMPCLKLAIRFNRPDMLKLFWQSGRSGVYFAVEQSGEVGPNDQVEVVESHPLKVSVAEVVSLFQGKNRDAALFDRVMESPLIGGWREGIQERWNSRH